MGEEELSFVVRLRSFPFPVCAVRRRVRGVRRLGRGVFFRASLRLGIFGGAFDPAHRGHASVAAEAQRKLLLGRVLWLVAHRPPLKASRAVSPFRTRWASARSIASRGRGGRGERGGRAGRAGGIREFCVSDIEERFGMVFSDEVVWSLRRSLREYDLVFLLGSDGFKGLARWRSWRVIGRMVSLAVFSRRGTDAQARLGLSARALPCARRGSSLLRLAGRGLRGDVRRWGFVSMPCVDASSSVLRRGTGS